MIIMWCILIVVPTDQSSRSTAFCQVNWPIKSQKKNMQFLEAASPPLHAHPQLVGKMKVLCQEYTAGEEF